MRKFWDRQGPENKISLVFNHLGQPCGRMTSKFVNFIGTLVKGKDVSMEWSSWTKVPQAEKDKLWESIKVKVQISFRLNTSGIMICTMV